MNRFLQGILPILIMGSILIGCSDSESQGVNKQKENNNAEIPEESSQKEMESLDDINKNISEWISKSNEIITENLDDPRIEETNDDEGFIYYLKAKKIYELVYSMENEDAATNNDIQRDIMNINSLYGIISHSQFSRTADFGPIGEAKEATEHSEDWKPTTEEMKKAYEYMGQILHDLDIAVNHNGEGETYGVTYTLNGDNVSEIQRNEYWNID